MGTTDRQHLETGCKSQLGSRKTEPLILLKIDFLNQRFSFDGANGEKRDFRKIKHLWTVWGIHGAETPSGSCCFLAQVTNQLRTCNPAVHGLNFAFQDAFLQRVVANP